MPSTRAPRPVLAVAFALIFLGIVGFGSYLALSALLRQLAGVTSDVGKGLVTAGATVFAAFLSLVIGKIWEQRVKINEDIRQKKMPVYEDLMALLFSFFASEAAAKPTDEETHSAFRKFTQKIVIWGGPEAIKTWTAFRLHGWKAGESREGFLKFEAFVKAIRKELGNKNAPLQDGDLLKLFINDLDLSKASTAGGSKTPPE
jgi:hypothetical protein